MIDPADDLKAIYTAAIDAVDPFNAVKSHLLMQGRKLALVDRGAGIASYDLSAYERIFIVGAGKATAPMASAVETILGDRITGGCICVKYGYTRRLGRIETIEAAHPVPDENGVRAAARIMDVLHGARENDLVISLISGGGSALLPYPSGSITLDEKRATTQLLLKSGASIHEINAVRKHLSRVKGGNMARAAYPATVINLMISDVVGDRMDVIASGPFVPDNSRFADGLAIIEKYSLRPSVPASVIDYLERGASGLEDENPGGGSGIFKNVRNLIVASNIMACEAARAEAIKRGYNSLILSSLVEGDTADAAFWHSRIAKEIVQSGNPVPPPACIISGGETTVRVKGGGLGGRNMEFALQSAFFIDGVDNVLVASIGTDGSDGPTDAAGACARGSTVRTASGLGLSVRDYLDRNDSYHFFERLGDLIITGPTNTNVMDIRVILAWE
ncbi:MAG TPA: glycerate kinase [Spirochaetota bacterium]|nr:glycerate kinase [Spirochaetota bacterium]